MVVVVASVRALGGTSVMHVSLAEGFDPRCHRVGIIIVAFVFIVLSSCVSLQCTPLV